MTTRSRRQTRARRFDLPEHRWPLVHNAEVALVKARRRADKLTIRQVGPAGLRVYVFLDEMSTAAYAASERLREITREYAKLDRMAFNGLDVREEMDALAAEEAELTRAEQWA